MAAIAKLKELQAHLGKLHYTKFNYEREITKFDPKQQCNSVCCMIGWLPLWFPDDFEYRYAYENTIVPLDAEGISINAKDTPTIVGLTWGEFNALFIGDGECSFAYVKEVLGVQGRNGEQKTEEVKDFFGLSYAEYRAIFYGNSLWQSELGLPITSCTSSLKKVRHLLKCFIEKKEKE